MAMAAAGSCARALGVVHQGAHHLAAKVLIISHEGKDSLKLCTYRNFIKPANFGRFFSVPRLLTDFFTTCCEHICERLLRYVNPNLTTFGFVVLSAIRGNSVAGELANGLVGRIAIVAGRRVGIW